MQESRQKTQRLLWISILCYAVTAASVFLLPFSGSEEDTLSPAGFAAGIVFWAGLILGTLTYFLAWRQVRNHRGYQKLKAATRPGCISFGRNIPALVADILFIPMAVITIIGSCIRNVPELLMLVSMSLMLLTFFWHFVLNGRVYRYCFSNKKRPVRAKQSFAAENDETDSSAGEHNQSQSDREGV